MKYQQRVLVKFFFIIAFFLFLSIYQFKVYAAEEDWQLIAGPTIKVQAIIKPYINITINSPFTAQNNFSREGPAVIFDCNQGPGTYQALYPLSFEIISNTPFQIQFEATPLIEQNTKTIIAPERLAIRFNDPGTPNNTFSAFKEGEKKVIYKSYNGGVSFTTECDFQLDITYEDKAGVYEGAIFIEVLHQP